MNIIKTEESKVSAISTMNERDYLTDVLSNEKQICVNTLIFLTETSNLTLNREIKSILDTVLDLQRKSFDLAWNKGWYSLTSVTESEKKKAYQDLNKKLNEIKEKTA